MGGPPEAYGSYHVCVYLCVCLYVFRMHFSATAKKLSAKNCNASVTQQYLRSLFWLNFRINALLCSYVWRDLLTLMPVMSIPKSSEDRTIHSRLLFNCATGQAIT